VDSNWRVVVDWHPMFSDITAQVMAKEAQAAAGSEALGQGALPLFISPVTCGNEFSSS